jgi:ubiquinone/menaquinone biosynthesis C-methylase UbiE
VVKSDYNQFAADFSQTRQHAWPEFELLKPLLRKGDRVLDLGCGNGRLRESLDKSLIPNGNYFGFDVSNGLLAVARKKNPTDHFFQGNFAELLPFGADNFDVIAGIASFHHLLTEKEQLKCLQELHRILKPGGRVFLTTWKIPQKHLIPNLKRTDFWKSGFRNYLVPFGKQKHPRYYRWVHAKKLAQLLEKIGFKIQHSSLERNRNWVVAGTK